MKLKRLTFMIDEDLLKKARVKQAKAIKKSDGAVSLSQIFREAIKKGL